MEPNESNKYEELDVGTNVISNTNDIQILESEEVSGSGQITAVQAFELNYHTNLLH